MDISERGQNELKKVIMKRITQDNINRLANIMSSNLCELYFGIRTKFTEGKRLNVDFSNTWRIIQLFVTGIRSDCTFVQTLAKQIGINKNTVSDEKTSAINDRNKYLSRYKKQESCKMRRRLSTQAKNTLMGRNTRDKCRHRTEKLKPNEKASKKVKIKDKSQQKCSNCGQLGHTKSKCMQTI